MDEYAIVRAYLTSLGIGLLIGLERERAGKTARGLRTFALTTLTATTAGWLAQLAAVPWLPLAVLLALVLLVAFGAPHRNGTAGGNGGGDPDEHVGTTTDIALLLAYLLGWLVMLNESVTAVMLGLLTVLLLYFKTELHMLTRKLTRAELVSFLQAAVVAFIVLPLLPNREMGPYGAINPYHVGMLVVLIAALNLAGYAALKLLPNERAVTAIGVLGGVVSSTATTLAYARQTRDGRMPAPATAVITQLANLTTLARMLLLVAASAIDLLPLFAAVLACGVAAGAVPPLLAIWRQQAEPGVPAEVRNPADLRAALSFAALFAVLLLVSAAVNARFGEHGLYAVAAVSGLVNVDAVSLSALEMHGASHLATRTVLLTVLLAFVANMVFKLGAVAMLAGRQAAWPVALGYGLTTAGLAAGWLLFA
ncbi:MAG: MgtC/SapB family protein [Solimonas sp.]